MNVLRNTLFTAGAVLVLSASAAAQPVWHDPWLNWDFMNTTGLTAHDIDIIVESPNFYPSEVYQGQFPHFGTITDDFDGDGDDDTKLHWWSHDVLPGEWVHIGAGLQGSGSVIDAYWTDAAGNKIGTAQPIVYELTRVEPDPAGGGNIFMQLETTSQFFLENPGSLVELRNIRTFMDLPAELLGLADINESLDLSALSLYETTPTPSQVFLVDSFFDVFVGFSNNIGPQWESLLVGDLFWNGTWIGGFWNLNPQSPEPATLALLALGALFTLRRR